VLKIMKICQHFLKLYTEYRRLVTSPATAKSKCKSKSTILKSKSKSKSTVRDHPTDLGLCYSDVTSELSQNASFKVSLCNVLGKDLVTTVILCWECFALS